jgi:hypothetical protein
LITPCEGRQGFDAPLINALLINERHGFTAEETGEHIIENADIQPFLGLDGYSCKTQFDPSLMIHFPWAKPSPKVAIRTGCPESD